MTAFNMAVTTEAPNDGYTPVKVAAANNGHAQTVELYNPTALIVVATISCPLATGETSRTWTAADVVGTVAGLDASGSGAISDTVTLDPGERCRWVLTSTYDLTPNDANGDLVDFMTTTIVFGVTETTVGGVSVTDPDPYYFPLRSVYIGVGRPFFPIRTRNAEQLVHALFARMTDAELQEVIDWFEIGHTMHSLVKDYKYGQTLNATAASPGTGTPASSGLF